MKWILPIDGQVYVAESMAAFPYGSDRVISPARYHNARLCQSRTVVCEVDVNPDTRLKLSNSFRNFAFEDRFDLRSRPFLSEACPAEMTKIAAIFGASLK
jgi:hypothetical protein